MGSKYSHLSDADRWATGTKLKERKSLAGIARLLGRHRSTISREVRRGYRQAFDRYLTDFGRRYYALSRARAGPSRRKLDTHLRRPAWKTVLFGLSQDWPPQHLCDRLMDSALPSCTVLPGSTA